jgi:hypothetical protein
LELATMNWTLPVVARAYPNTDSGRHVMMAEAEVMGRHGYEPASQSEGDGHVHAGRLILTGGVSIFAGKAGIPQRWGHSERFDDRRSLAPLR